MGNMSLSRRRLLTGASATATLGARFKLGSLEATVVSDGPLSIGDPKNTFRGPTPKRSAR
jgi:hypothetical protein